MESGGVVEKIRLVGVGYGAAAAHAARAEEPVVSGNLVRYRRRRLVEWYRNGPLGLEQGFMLPRRLVSYGPGPLTLTLALRGSLVARSRGGDIVFVSRSGRVKLRYGELTVVDRTGRRLRSTLAVSDGRLLVRVWDRGGRYPLSIDPLIEPGVKLVGDCTQSCSGPDGTGEINIAGESGTADFGTSVALSDDGSTALVGAWGDNNLHGAAWVFTRSGSVWSQQGAKLIGDCTGSCSGPNGTGESGQGEFGVSVALSDGGNTALIGGQGDGEGAAWVFTRSGSVWSQQGSKLISDCVSACSGPNGTGGGGYFGLSVALSGDGDTALIGARGDRSDEGAAFVFTRSGSVWSQQGTKLVGDCVNACSGPNGTGANSSGEILGGLAFGTSVALSDSGDTALIGAPGDGSGAGAAWVFTRSGSVWSQQGTKLVGDCIHACSGPNGTGEINVAENGGGSLGESVALSGDGDTALIGAPGDRNAAGAAWVFTRSGSVWSQSGAKLVGDCTHACSGPNGVGEIGMAAFGISVAVSSDGGTALIGGWYDRNYTGAAWVFRRSGSVWRQHGAKLVGDCIRSCSGEGSGELGPSGFGSGVALPDQGDTALISAPGDNNGAGAVWMIAPRASSDRFTIRDIHIYRDGRIRVGVRLPGPGTVDVLATAWNDNLASIATLLRPAAHRFTFARAATTARVGGTTVLSVRPNALGRRLVLHHTYRVTLRLWITYTPPGVRPRSVGIYGLHLPHPN